MRKMSDEASPYNAFLIIALLVTGGDARRFEARESRGSRDVAVNEEIVSLNRSPHRFSAASATGASNTQKRSGSPSIKQKRGLNKTKVSAGVQSSSSQTPSSAGSAPKANNKHWKIDEEDGIQFSPSSIKERTASSPQHRTFSQERDLPAGLPTAESRANSIRPPATTSNGASQMPVKSVDASRRRSGVRMDNKGARFGSSATQMEPGPMLRTNQRRGYLKSGGQAPVVSAPMKPPYQYDYQQKSSFESFDYSDPPLSDFSSYFPSETPTTNSIVLCSSNMKYSPLPDDIGRDRPAPPEQECLLLN